MIKYKKLLTIFPIVVLFLLCSCQNNPQQTQDKCANSIIYKNIPNADLVSTLLIIQGMDNFKQLKQNLGLDPTPALYVLYKIDAKIDEVNMNYAEQLSNVNTMLKYVNQYTGVHIKLSDELLRVIDDAKDSIIDSCDREFLHNLIGKLILAFNMS